MTRLASTGKTLPLRLVRQREPVLSAVPAGYDLVYEEDFTSYASIDEVVENGQVPAQGKPFADSFVQFGVRYLVGNNDRCYKALAGDTGAIAGFEAELECVVIAPGDRENIGAIGLDLDELGARGVGGEVVCFWWSRFSDCRVGWPPRSSRCCQTDGWGLF